MMILDTLFDFISLCLNKQQSQIELVFIDAI